MRAHVDLPANAQTWFQQILFKPGHVPEISRCYIFPHLEYSRTKTEELQQTSESCRAKQVELSWEKKAEQMVEIYHNAIAQHEAK